MQKFLRAEIDGDAASCAAFISELRQSEFSLLIDWEGFLLVPESEWEEVEFLADSFGCNLFSPSFAQRAA